MLSVILQPLNEHHKFQTGPNWKHFAKDKVKIALLADFFSLI